ncbi:MAG: glyoxylate/hydroxypyruvate reductase A [Betaproteobacteria bacterium]|nr:glyoxylate/hydroxypyruvate reductase A [Betaproteobacteria bacterium]MCC6249531.1 glyoxylate/hydroxypyruvate reductase A [Rubrivivax sp.]
MKIVLAGDFDDAEEHQRWHEALAQALPEAHWLGADAAAAYADEVSVAVVANPPPGSLAPFRHLRLIQSLWAGVDRLLADASLPAGVPIARMVDPAMSAAMAETALWATLALHRGFFTYQRQQRDGVWRALAQRRADEAPVLVLGRGEMGRAVAARLRAQGYPVTAWGRDGAPLAPLLAAHEIVINLLPLTAATRGLLDRRFFAAMREGAALVNLGRGAHVVDDDLLAALDAGHLSHAVLDVFHAEPLPTSHRYWTHARVTMLPHAAAATDERSAAAVVAANLRALEHGRPLAHLVDRGRGY